MIVYISLFSIIISDTDNGSSEYCESETFHPRCADGNVIMILKALYGRMRIGRCVTSGLGFLGCHSGKCATLILLRFNLIYDNLFTRDLSNYQRTFSLVVGDGDSTTIAIVLKQLWAIASIARARRGRAIAKCRTLCTYSP